RYYEAALAADELSKQLSAPERAELHYRAGFARYRDLDVGPCLAHYEKAIEAYQLTGDVRGLARALMERTRALSTIASVSIGTLLDLQPLADVLNELRDAEPGLCGRGWATMATAYWMARQPERAEEVAQHALELGQRIQDDALCAQSSCELGLAQMQSLRLQEALESYQSALVYARRVDDPWLQGWPLQRLPLVLTLLGRLDEAETLARQACEAAHESQDWSHYSLALAVLETVAVAKGDFAAAESYAQRAMVMVHRSHYPWGGLIALSVLACTRSLRGAWSAAEDALTLLVEPGRVFAEPGPAVQAIAQGYHQLLQAHSQPPQAIREQLTATPWQATDHAPPDIFSLASFCALVEVGDLVADPRLAERSYRALSLAAEQGVMFSPLWLFLLPRVLGVAATLNHWWDDAEAHFQAAIDLATRVGALPELGRSYLDYARLLAARGGESDRHRASELGEQAHSLFTALGMHPFCQRAAHLIQTLQASRSRTRTASQELNQTTRHSDTSRSGALQIPPCPPLQKGGSAQRGGISARSDTNVPGFDLDPSQPQTESNLFRQEGEYWTLAYQGTVCRVRDARGLRYLAYLLRHPHQQVHVL